MRTVIIIILAVFAAGGTAFLVKSMLGLSTQEARSKENPLPQILVTRHDIPAGSFVRADDQLEWIAWPSDNLSDAYIMPDRGSIEEFDGAVSRQDISAGEPIIRKRLVKPGEGGFMSAVLNPKMRAVSISVNLTSGNAGFIFPGDRVDLLLTHTVPNDDGSEGFAAETIIENVRVLAMDQRYNANSNVTPSTLASPARSATLEVSPRHAEMIHVAKELGKLSLSLRSIAEVDKEQSKELKLGMKEKVILGRTYTRDSDVSHLLGRTAPHVIPKTVSVVRGDESEDIHFDGVR